MPYEEDGDPHPDWLPQHVIEGMESTEFADDGGDRLYDGENVDVDTPAETRDDYWRDIRE